VAHAACSTKQAVVLPPVLFSALALSLDRHANADANSVIDFELLKGKHDGTNIANRFFDILQSYNFAEIWKKSKVPL